MKTKIKGSTVIVMPLTDTDKDRIKRYLDKKITIEEALEEIKRDFE